MVRASSPWSSFASFALCAWLAGGCIDFKDSPSKEASETPPKVVPAKSQKPTEPPPRELLEPVEVWKNGQKVGQIDAQGKEAAKYVFIDLGEAFTPILFADGVGVNGEPLPHSFRETYLALARGEFPKGPYGERAQRDKYLELYGINPTLSVMRKRIHWAAGLECSKALDLSAIASFKGVVAYRGPAEALSNRQRYMVSHVWVERFLAKQGLTDATLIRADQLKEGERGQLKYYLREHDDFEAIKAAQDRLQCEGYFKGKGKYLKGAFDWATHEALAEFERRHRVFSWGTMGADTLEALRMDTREAEHETLIRVLTERAIHAFGALEDGSAKNNDETPTTFKGTDGRMHQVPNLEAELRSAVIEGFGLKDPAASMAFLDSLGDLPKDGHRYVALPGPARPEYYSSDMELSVSIDRGDVWFEFPYDENGAEKPQPVSRRPRTTIFVNYHDQRIPIARFGTTIGGWRSELIDDNVFWKYKGSPKGEVLWEEIVSAPVWLPPSTTPPRDLLKRREKRKPNQPKYEVNYHETGPSYASAYGLVAAYHRPFQRSQDGTVRVTGDEGIRSHGSVDYMSIMRRHSHGCHRLHNHIAVRLFAFVVQHRPHHREGHQPTAFTLNFVYEEEPYSVQIKQGGYAFRLERPIFVMVEEGRIRGSVEHPLAVAIPKFDDVCKAYYMPDGTTVIPQADGTMVPSTPPPCDAGVPLLPEPGIDLTVLPSLDPTGATVLGAPIPGAPVLGAPVPVAPAPAAPVAPAPAVTPPVVP